MKTATNYMAILALALLSDFTLVIDGAKHLRGWDAEESHGDQVQTEPSSFLGGSRRFLQANGASAGSISVIPAGGSPAVGNNAGTALFGTGTVFNVVGAGGKENGDDNADNTTATSIGNFNDNDNDNEDEELQTWTCPPGQFAKYSPEEGSFFCMSADVP